MDRESTSHKSVPAGTSQEISDIGYTDDPSGVRTRDHNVLLLNANNCKQNQFKEERKSEHNGVEILHSVGFLICCLQNHCH